MSAPVAGDRGGDGCDFGAARGRSRDRREREVAGDHAGVFDEAAVGARLVCGEHDDFEAERGDRMDVRGVLRAGARDVDGRVRPRRGEGVREGGGDSADDSDLRCGGHRVGISKIAGRMSIPRMPARP